MSDFRIDGSGVDFKGRPIGHEVPDGQQKTPVSPRRPSRHPYGCDAIRPSRPEGGPLTHQLRARQSQLLYEIGEASPERLFSDAGSRRRSLTTKS